MEICRLPSVVSAPVEDNRPPAAVPPCQTGASLHLRLEKLKLQVELLGNHVHLNRVVAKRQKRIQRMLAQMFKRSCQIMEQLAQFHPQNHDCIGFKLCCFLATRWRHFSSKLHHQVAPLALVEDFSNRWHQFYIL